MFYICSFIDSLVETKMTASLTFYTNPMSRGQIVRWMLEEVGAPYEQVLLDYGTTMKAPEYLAINPMGKVPAIKHGDRVVTECAAICAYLAEAFPESGLAPAADERADYYRWLFFAAGPVEQALSNHALKWEPTAEQQRMVGYGSFDTVVDALERLVTGRQFIAGDRFSAADLYVGSHIDWGMQFGTLAKRDAFEAYVAPFRQRPAYQRAKAIDGALIAEMQKDKG
jgi:glutathione S-transferase